MSVNVIKPMQLFILAVAIMAQSVPASPGLSNALMGQWARDKSACERPELIFKPTVVIIQIDADGKFVTFTYQRVFYRVDNAKISVSLKKKHPYGKTATDTGLQFLLKNDNGLDMLLLKGKTVAVVRCR